MYLLFLLQAFTNKFCNIKAHIFRCELKFFICNTLNIYL